MTRHRATVRTDTTLRGVGLFTGRPATVTMHPADPASGGGIWFRRIDLPGRPDCRATIESLSSRPVHPAFGSMPPRSTTLETTAGDLVATVEHVLSALAGVGITDAILDLSGPEMPLLDASSLDFVRAIEGAGIEPGRPIEPRTIPRRIEVRGQGAVAIALPRTTPGCSFRYDLDYGPGSPLLPQSAAWDGTRESYRRDVAPARTFCLEAEADAMRRAGLLAHLSERDALVIGQDGPIGTAYRFPDEPARHKLLDLIGDLALIGQPVDLDVHASRAGHAMNHRLALEIVRSLSG